MSTPEAPRRHQLVDEHVYEDMVLCSLHPAHIVDKVKDVTLSDGDILLASYPKTGTTWSQELIWLLCNGGDTAKAGTIRLMDRFPHLEFSFSADGPHLMDAVLETAHPRLIKTHLPVRFFPKVFDDPSVKVVVVVRNPKDTLVSMYHFYRMNKFLGMFTGTWDEFFALYESRHMYMGDFFDWYSGWWQYKDNPNVLFITYEDMKSDLKKVVLRVADFLQKTSFTDDEYDKIVRHLGFDQMKDNKMTDFKDSPVLRQDISPFMRKGVVGDWRNHFTEAQSELVDRRYKETLEKAGLILQS